MPHASVAPCLRCGVRRNWVMNRRVSFFLLVTLAASVAHYSFVMGLSQLVMAGGVMTIGVPVLWVFTAPMNFLLSSSFGLSLSPTPFQLLFITNSFVWGSAIGAVTLWRKLRYE